MSEMHPMMPPDAMGPPEMGGPPPDMGPPPEPPPEAADPSGADDPVQMLKTAFELLHRYQGLPSTDDIETAAVSKLAAGIQALLGKEQSELQTALGSNATHRVIQKAAASGGY